MNKSSTDLRLPWKMGLQTHKVLKRTAAAPFWDVKASRLLGFRALWFRA